MSGQHVSMATYKTVFAALMAMLVVTVLVALFTHLGPFTLLIAMVIALTKAVLVVVYFMHVRYSSKLTKVFVVASFMWFAVLFSLTFSDYLARGTLQMSRGWVDQAQRAGTAHTEPPAPHGSSE